MPAQRQIKTIRALKTAINTLGSSYLTHLDNPPGKTLKLFGSKHPAHAELAETLRDFNGKYDYSGDQMDLQAMLTWLADQLLSLTNLSGELLTGITQIFKDTPALPSKHFKLTGNSIKEKLNNLSSDLKRHIETTFDPRKATTAPPENRSSTVSFGPAVFIEPAEDTPTSPSSPTQPPTSP